MRHTARVAQSKNPLKAIVDIRREEWGIALSMFAYFFLVISTFWILKPLKKSLFIGYYDATGFELLNLDAAQAELVAKVANMFVALAATAIFSIMSSRFQRHRLTLSFTVFVSICFVGYAAWLPYPSDLLVWTFYLFGDLYSSLMVVTFFAFMNDSVDPDQAKRIYGVVGLGGVSGGAFGTTLLAAFIDDISPSGWMFVALGIGAVIAVLATVVGRRVEKERGVTEAKPKAPEPGKKEAPKGNAALEGARLVFKTPYLLSIVAIVGTYEMVSTIMDFQFSSTVAHYTSGAELSQHFANVFAITNATAFVIQLLFTSLVMSQLGVGIALLFLPMAALLSSGAFLAAPVLLVGSALNTADNAFAYSINQSAKEVLYVPTTREEKYKAKAFIDMFVQRFAKALAVGLSLLITILIDDFSGVRWLSILTVLFLVPWIMAARYVGKAFAEKEKTA